MENIRPQLRGRLNLTGNFAGYGNCEGRAAKANLLFHIENWRKALARHKSYGPILMRECRPPMPTAQAHHHMKSVAAVV